MAETGAFEAKNTFGSLLDRVARGEEIVIMRHGKPVARMVAPQVTRVIDKQAAMATYDHLRAHAKQLNLGPFDWEEYKKDRDAGRP